MTEYSIGDVADRAGVANDYVVMLVELGILSSAQEDHFSEGDVRRVRLLQTLERAGMPLQGVAAAVRSGNLSLGFLDTAAYDRLASLSDVTLQEVSEKTEIPVELLMVIREAVGFAEPQPEDRLRENELQIVPLVEAQISEGFRLTVIERWLRVYGDSLRRIAETEVDWWHTEVELPLLKSGMTPAEMMEAADSRVAQRIAPYLDQTILAMYHGHQEHTWMKSILDGIEATLSEAGVYSRLERPPAICFLDITGYTRLTEERGDEAAAELAGTLSRMVRRSSRSHGGKPVKWLGDGVMFFFPDPGSGVLAALDMVKGAANAGLPPAHVGLHAGPVLFQEGDYYGRTVNVAARIAEYARPGEVVVSQDVVEVVDAIPVSFVEIGPVELKGVSGALRLHTTRRDT
jgi:class 3 adenylate cyclase/DNA-binding transcriptional MerR regulator